MIAIKLQFALDKGQRVSPYKPVPIQGIACAVWIQLPGTKNRSRCWGLSVGHVRQAVQSWASFSWLCLPCCLYIFVRSVTIPACDSGRLTKTLKHLWVLLSFQEKSPFLYLVKYQCSKEQQNRNSVEADIKRFALFFHLSLLLMSNLILGQWFSALAEP